MAFDPEAAAQPGGGIFGLPPDAANAAVILVPVPFAATVSYGGGAEQGPAAMLAASSQVDLYDAHFGRVYEAGIFLEEAAPEVAAAHQSGRGAAAPLIAGGGVPAGDERCAQVDEAGAVVNRWLGARVRALLEQGKIVGVLGGDHSVPFAAIAAAAERGSLGVLHVDAHADLREAYEGFAWSHASIMHNVLAACPNVERLVQVGVRDYSEAELRAKRAEEALG